MVSSAVLVKNLTKKFGDKIAVDGVSFTVKQGEIFSLLGPNEAGKTTLMSILAGISHPTSGDVKILDKSPFDSKTRNLIGYCPQDPVVYEGMTGIENMMFYAGLHGLGGKEAKKRSLELLDFVGLSEYAKKKVKVYSGGTKKRLNFAIALVGDPQVLLLDEPTTGMDPRIRRFVWERIEQLKKQNKTIILATHYMEEADMLSDRVAIMDRGKIIAEGSPEELKKESGLKAVINVELIKPDTKVIELLKPYAYEGKVVAQENVLRIHTDDPDKTAPKVVSELLSHKYSLISLKISPPTLEDVFLRLTGRRLIEE